jgi:site-specific DNA-methyltransferase (adenine-specific)
VTPYYEQDGITIYHGDCREVLDAVRPYYDAVVSDPPWGTDTACDSKRFTRKASPFWANVDNSKVRTHKQIANDEQPFAFLSWVHSPERWVDGSAILWGANNFCTELPISNGWLIWDKRKGAEDMAEKGWPLGEAELAWTNIIGATRVFRNLWSGLLRSSEKGEFYHPTQKPIALMEWSLSFLPKEDRVILDPFMGAGSTLIAAKRLGLQAIGIELEEVYCERAAKRLSQPVDGKLPMEFSA